MTQLRSVDERISAWLLDEAPEQLPDRVLQAAFERTRVDHRRRRWLGRRDLRMLRVTPAMVAVGAAAIVIAVVGVALFPRSNPSTIGGPSASPVESPSATAAATPGESIAPVALGGDVAISRTVDGNTDIYLVPADGGPVQRLTTDPAVDQFASWSPDGTMLLFTRTTSVDPELSDIYAIDMATRSEVKLTSGGGRHAGAVMSPDGRRIAYDQSPSDPGFHVMNANGSNNRLAYAIHDDRWNLGGWASNSAVYVKRGDFDFLVVDLDTQAVTTVVSGGPDLGDPALSPDRTTFAFRSSRGDGGLFLMDVDGSNVRSILRTTTKGPISWAPDGKHIILAQADGWLYVVGSDGTGLIRWMEGSFPSPRPSP
jgi:Tol biopolymer transport system component